MDGAPNPPLGQNQPDLKHVPVHGQHHRGQVNADLRSADVAPPRIDYSHASTSGALDT